MGSLYSDFCGVLAQMRGPLSHAGTGNEWFPYYEPDLLSFQPSHCFNKEGFCVSPIPLHSPSGFVISTPAPLLTEPFSSPVGQHSDA